MGKYKELDDAMQGTIHLLRKHIFGLFELPFPLYKQILCMKISENCHFVSSNQEIHKFIMEQNWVRIFVKLQSINFALEILREQSEHSTDSQN